MDLDKNVYPGQAREIFNLNGVQFMRESIKCLMRQRFIGKGSSLFNFQPQKAEPFILMKRVLLPPAQQGWEVQACYLRFMLRWVSTLCHPQAVHTITTLEAVHNNPLCTGEPLRLVSKDDTRGQMTPRWDE